MEQANSLLFNKFTFTANEIAEIEHKLADPLVRAYIQTILAVETEHTLSTFNSTDLAKIARDVTFVNGMKEIGSKLIFVNPNPKI